MKVKKLKNLVNKSGSTGSKWSNLNAQRYKTAHCFDLLQKRLHVGRVGRGRGRLF